MALMLMSMLATAPETNDAILQIIMSVDLLFHFFADQAASVDDTGVIQFVGEQHITFDRQCGEHRLVGVPATDVR